MHLLDGLPQEGDVCADLSRREGHGGVVGSTSLSSGRYCKNGSGGDDSVNDVSDGEQVGSGGR